MKLWIEEINEGVETEEEKLEEGASLVLIVYDARFDRILNVRGSGDGGGGGEEGGGGGEGRGSLELVLWTEWGNVGFWIENGSEEGGAALTFFADEIGRVHGIAV